MFRHEIAQPGNAGREPAFVSEMLNSREHQRGHAPATLPLKNSLFLSRTRGGPPDIRYGQVQERPTE